MSRSKSKTLWRWMLLFSPAIISIAAPLAGPPAETFLRGSRSAYDNPYDPVVWSIGGLLAALVISPALGFWFTPKDFPPLKKGLVAVLCTLVVIFINGAVAFGGCAATTALWK